MSSTDVRLRLSGEDARLLDQNIFLVKYRMKRCGINKVSKNKAIRFLLFNGLNQNMVVRPVNKPKPKKKREVLSNEEIFGF